MKELLRLESVKKYFPAGKGALLKAVDNISFSVLRSQVFGLVGESGCGKSTVAKLILKLIKPTEGRIFFDGMDVANAKGTELSRLRKGLQIIFQDPQAALNPRKRVMEAVGEAFIVNRMVKRKSDLQERVLAVLRKVGLDESALYKYPHEFSGGQRQRICIARALAVEPRLIVADEPLSALDVSIQAQIINLLEDLQKDSDLSYVLISHDLRVIEHFSDVVAVMYLGKIIEMSGTSELFNRPLHPYSEALLSAVPSREVDKRSGRIILQGDIPGAVDVPPGCPFHPRCHKRFGPCDRIVPEYGKIEKNRWAACHLLK